jgi:hypothetical protein
MTAAAKSRKRAASPSSELDRTERWVMEVVSHPEGVEAGLSSKSARKLIDVPPEELSKVILPSKNLSSAERIGIYQSMYFVRLVECLEKDFEVVKHVLGEKRFNDVAMAYLIKHPSTHYSLNKLSDKFPHFIEKEVKDIPHRAFLAELAELELMVQHIFDERDAKPVTVDDLLSVRQDKWPTTKLRTIPALRMMTFAYPTNQYMQAVINKKPPRKIPGRKKTWLAIYRRSHRVCRAQLTLEKFTLLSAIVAGKPLGEALETCAGIKGVNPKKLAASIGAWFKEWAEDGIFCAIA